MWVPTGSGDTFPSRVVLTSKGLGRSWDGSRPKFRGRNCRQPPFRHSFTRVTESGFFHLYRRGWTRPQGEGQGPTEPGRTQTRPKSGRGEKGTFRETHYPKGKVELEFLTNRFLPGTQRGTHKQKQLSFAINTQSGGRRIGSRPGCATPRTRRLGVGRPKSGRTGRRRPVVGLGSVPPNNPRHTPSVLGGPPPVSPARGPFPRCSVWCSTCLQSLRPTPFGNVKTRSSGLTVSVPVGGLSVTSVVSVPGWTRPPTAGRLPWSPD